MKISMLLSMLAILCLLGCPVQAEEGKVVTITGVVYVSYDDDGKVATVAVTDDAQTVYNITVDEKARKMAVEMDGLRATITGKSTSKGGNTWVTLKTYKAAKEEEVAEEQVPETNVHDDW